jgi:hypothetical protein
MNGSQRYSKILIMYFKGGLRFSLLMSAKLGKLR